MTTTAAVAPVGETPILDRGAPLPPRAAPGSGLAWVLAAWVGAIAVVVTLLLLERPAFLSEWARTERPWLFGPWSGTRIIALGAALACAFYLMILIHELGHVLAGLCAGFRFRSLRVGPILINKPLRVSLYRGPGAATNGQAELTLLATKGMAWRGVTMVMGGPTANILSGLTVLALPLPPTVFRDCFALLSLVNGVNDLFPFEGRLGVSDGRRIWMLLRQRARGERWLALLRLNGDLKDGVLPESMPNDLLAKATALRDPSADTVSGHAFAYAAAFHRREDCKAARLLETCLAYSGYAGPDLREALMSDAAVFQARRRKRADLAGQWLADIPAETRRPWLRTRAEAAIREAGGDAEGAMVKLAEVEAAFLALPAGPHRETLLALLRRWKSDLRGD